MEDEGYAEGHQQPVDRVHVHVPTPTQRDSLVHALVAEHHTNLLARGGAGELWHPDVAITGLPPSWIEALGDPDARRRQELAYLLMLSLPTPALSALQDRLAPFTKLDWLALLPPELARHVLTQLDVGSVLNASLVCRAWRSLIWQDHLLWKAMYERHGWVCDRAAVDWWNNHMIATPPPPAYKRHASRDSDEGMAMDEDDIRPPLAFLHPPPPPPSLTTGLEDAVQAQFATERGSPSLGLPPSPRHSGHPPLRSSARVSPVPEVYMGGLEIPASQPAPHFRLQSPPPQRTRRASSLSSPTKTSLIETSDAPRPLPPSGFDPSRVSRAHFDSEGRPWVCWRQLFITRTIIERNWRHGRFTMHELHKPSHRYPSTGQAPVSEHPVGAPFPDGVYAIQFDGDRLVAGLRGGVAIRYNLRTGEPQKQYRFHTGSVLCLQYDADDTRLEGVDDRLVTGSSDGHAVVWDLETGRLLQDLHGHNLSVLCVRFAGDVLATCSKDRLILLWSMSAGRRLHTLSGHRSAVNALTLKHGILASASGDRDVRIWSTETGECLRILSGHIGGIAALAFDGYTIATGSSDSTVRLVDCRTGIIHVEIGTPELQGLRNPAAPREPRPPFPTDQMVLFSAGNTAGLPPGLHRGHSDLVRTLAFDSRFIVTGSYDETIKVWDRYTGLLLLDLHAHSTRVFNLQFDVSRLVSCSQAGVEEIRIFDFGGGLDTSFLKA